MGHLQFILFSVGLLLLILLSAFFSCAETALMVINRYRLRHKARMKKKYAILILRLLKRPDRLLGVLLLGNNFSNIVASAIATLLAVHLWGEKGVIFSTVLLTLLVLIFAEVAPKTLAALYPERIAKIVIWPVYAILKLFYPMVWGVNVLSNSLLRFFRVNISSDTLEPLSHDELRNVVYEAAGKFSRQYQTMLLGILDLKKMAVEDVMIPQHEVKGIDLEQSFAGIQKQIAESQHDWLPVYREHMNHTVGLLHLRDLMQQVVSEKGVDKAILLTLLHEPYFIPMGTPLNIQLLHFQQQRKRLALVVDEYGEIQGLVTLEDILERIVGEFTTHVTSANTIQAQSDNTYLVPGMITIRELNRALQFDLPTNGPRTLNGLITEYLEMLPRAGVGVRIAGYPIEIVRVKGNQVAVARVFPK